MDRHRVVAGQVAHPARRLARRRAEEDTDAGAAGQLDDDALRVRLAGARKPGEKNKRPPTDELDNLPLLVRHLDPLGPSRGVEQFVVRCRRALGERSSEARLGLPRLGEVDALALNDDLLLACQPGERRLEGLCVVHLEQPRRRLPQLRKRQEDVAVAGRLGEHEEEARAQPLRRVELDAKRARNAVGHAETDPRHLGQPVRIVLEHGDHVRSRTYGRAARRGPPRSRARTGTPQPRGWQRPHATPRPPAPSHDARSRGPPSSAPPVAAPDHDRVRRRHAPRRNARRSHAQRSGQCQERDAAATTQHPPPSAARPSGTTQRRTASRNARAARPRRQRRCSPRRQHGQDRRAA